MADRVDTAKLLASVDLAEVIGRYVQLEKRGPEFTGLCPFHTEKTPSFTVSPVKGFYHCFGCGAHGNAIDFVMEVHGVEFLEAVNILGGGVGVPERRVPAPAAVPEWRPICPVPDNAPPLLAEDTREARLYNPKRVGTSKEWATLYPALVDPYVNADGQVLGYVLRCEFKDGGKFTPQVTYCLGPNDEKRWCMVAMPEPRPLLGLDDLARRTKAPVLVVEGEKTRRAAMRLLSPYVVVTWAGGANGVDHADWRPLFARDVLVWPDADSAGLAALLGSEHAGRRRDGIADYLRGNVTRLRYLDTTGQPDGWDAADAADVGWTAEDVIRWAKPRAKDVPSRATSATKAPPPEPPITTQETATPKPSLAVAKTAKPEPRAAAAGKPALAVVQGTGALKAAIPAPDTPPVEQSVILLWQQLRLDLNGKGMPHQNLDNVVRVLHHHPDAKGHFWFDVFLQRFMSDWSPVGGACKPREWQDADDLALAVWMQRVVGLVRVGDDLVNKAVRTLSMHNLRNSVREWLEQLTWDGTPRLERVLCSCFGAEDSEYVRAVGKNVFVSMAARILSPGCQVDNMMILEGEQGIKKSSALALIGGDWYSAAHESVTSKDFYVALQGKLLVEIVELDAFSRAETTKIKHVVTNRWDRFRMPYARKSEDYARMNIFIGTTNQDRYLRDETGGRRWWPIVCGRIDLDELRTQREQLFAEAVHAFKAGTTWWEIPGETAKDMQDSRRVFDEWETPIAEWLKRRDEATGADILEFALGINMKDADRPAQVRVANAMRVLGWRIFVTKKKEAGKWVSHRVWRPRSIADLPGLPPRSEPARAEGPPDDLPFDEPK